MAARRRRVVQDVVRRRPRLDATRTPRSYPDIARALKAKSEFGAELSVVEFEGRASMNVGIPVPDFATGEKLATQLSRTLDDHAEVICGAPIAKRTLVLDVAKGTLANGRSLVSLSRSAS